MAILVVALGGVVAEVTVSGPVPDNG